VGGAGEAVFVAVAYDLAGSCAGTAPGSGDVVPEAVGVALMACGGCWTLGEIALVMSERAG